MHSFFSVHTCLCTHMCVFIYRLRAIHVSTNYYDPWFWYYRGRAWIFKTCIYYILEGAWKCLLKIKFLTLSFVVFLFSLLFSKLLLGYSSEFVVVQFLAFSVLFILLFFNFWFYSFMRNYVVSYITSLRRLRTSKLLGQI